MDVLKQFALPQSLEHFHLLLMILNLVYVVFLPYLGFLFGASVLSFVECRWGRRSGDPKSLALARTAIDTVLNDWQVVAFLGVIPALTLVFIYAQLLQGTGAIAVTAMGWSLVLLILAIVLLWRYRGSFRLEGAGEAYRALQALHDGHADGIRELAEYSVLRTTRQVRTGGWGVALLCLSTFLAVGAMGASVNPESWSGSMDLPGLLLMPAVLVRFAQFIALSFGATGVGLLFFQYGIDADAREGSDLLGEYGRARARTLAMVSLLLQPLLIVVSLMLLPPVSLSGGVFGLAGASLLMFFLAAHFVYAYHKRPARRYASYAFYAVGVSMLLLFTADQAAIGNATRDHSARLAYLYDRSIDELKSKLGVGAVAMTGEEIFSARCSACHEFDKKKVGPPYRETLPKYGGDKTRLVAFILNPVKVNPAYPPMPNQGLKPAEADSIATFLLSKVAGSVPAQAGTTAPGGD